MKDLVLIFAVLILMTFVYQGIKRIDVMKKLRRRIIADKDNNHRCKIRIGAENRIMHDKISDALNRCKQVNMYLEFINIVGKPEKLLKKLSKGKVDIVLLNENHIQGISQRFALVKVGCQHKNENTYSKEKVLYAVWNKSIHSKYRDNIVFLIENQ